jgi:hypothetical protein
MAKILGTPRWWWKWFTATTPRGRHKGAGELYGALLVESVDGEAGK